MNHKQLVKATNIIAILGILGLIYWVFGFILIQVFGLKVFEKNLTEMFGFSILGILAVLAGALILNIMLNLTRIAEQKENPNTAPTPATKSHMGKFLVLGMAMFGVIASGLFWGDYVTTQRKFTLMQTSTNQVVEKYHDSLDFLGDFRFEKTWIDTAIWHTELLRATDNNVNQVTIIVPDKIDDEAVYLGFDEYKQSHAGLPSDDDLTKGNAVVFEIAEAIGSVADDTTPTKKYHLKKTDFIFRTDTAQRQALDQMFAGQAKPHHSSYDGRYEMFYPYQVDGKTVAVLYLTDYLHYGKINSGSY
ncbi:Uncharacterised protein [Moraxella lacunata]|uniref:Uncharacterized protein n=1 Tax=Moraxella lacunata TaxID=477 RepID=A0A378TQR1_MORLA|nr:hypothetical protein [Moraxella lacunata]STZ63126.1 Uncharacterised protein [Moraxella lacunata]